MVSYYLEGDEAQVESNGSKPVFYFAYNFRLRKVSGSEGQTLIPKGDNCNITPPRYVLALQE